MSTLFTMAQMLNRALDEILKSDSTAILIGEDIGINGGVFRITDGLHQKYPSRVLDTPLAENMIAGISIGMAIKGLRPIAEFQFLAFIYPALEQIISHASKMRYRTQGRLSCPLIFRTPYGGGVGAPEHHSESTEGIFAQIPGLRVLVPSTPTRAYALMKSAHLNNDPVIFLEPTRMYHSTKQNIPSSLTDNIQIDQAIIEHTGNHLTLISWGAMMLEARKIVAEYSKHNISIELIDLVSLRPLDYKTILNSVRKTKRCIILSEAPKTIGVASEIITFLQENLFDSLLSPIMRVNADDHVIPYSKLEGVYRPNMLKISKVINKVLKWKKQYA